jgi:cation diffusion facilitator CzcD-associated flavoprotein CzcO
MPRGRSAGDVVIVGAGPFGLAVASHLRARGVDAHVLGDPMGGWTRHMPVNMFIRTPWDATHIADPAGDLTLDRYVALGELRKVIPLPLRDFIRYGLWFQSRAVPDVDRRSATRIEPAAHGFRLVLDDGDRLESRRVVVATGIAQFAQRPREFEGLPPALVSHSSEHSCLDRYAGRRVVVIGGGLSAFEYAAHLNDAGADVEVVMRARSIRWLDEFAGVRRIGWGRRVYRHVRPHLDALYPPTGVGAPPINWITATPGVFRRLPHRVRRRINHVIERGIIQHGTSWLWPRLQGVVITRGRRVTSARATASRVVLRLDDGTTRTADHVMLATGYAIDVARYPFLEPGIVRALERIGGYPRLRAGFESSVPGLHFVGTIAQGTYGPTMYSVGGTGYAARAVTRWIVERRAETNGRLRRAA